MDPIKVDFTKKKDDGIIIKPAKAGLKIFLNILITLVGAGIAYYIMLPPMNFKSTDMYIFFVIVALIYVAAAAITSGALRKGEYIPYVEKAVDCAGGCCAARWQWCSSLACWFRRLSSARTPIRILLGAEGNFQGSGYDRFCQRASD